MSVHQFGIEIENIFQCSSYRNILAAGLAGELATRFWGLRLGIFTVGRILSSVLGWMRSCRVNTLLTIYNM
jgi:hypothetical protein